MPRWVGPTFFVLFQVALVGTCLTIAIAFDIVERITSSQEAFSHTIAAGVVAAIVLMLVLFIVRQYAKSKVQRAAQEGLANAERLAQMLVGGERVDGSERRQAVEAAFGAAPRLLEFWILSSTYWRLFLGLGSVVGAAVLVAQLLTLTEQTRRLGEQNSLLTDQNQLVQLEANLAAISRRADYDQQQAARVYDEITRSLNANASAAAIEIALDRLPGAMVMPVTVVDPAWRPTPESVEPDKQTVYPSLKPLAQRLLAYAKIKRPASGVVWSDEEVGRVSTAVVQALHRLGHGAFPEVVEGGCVWHAVYDELGELRNDADERLSKLVGHGKPIDALGRRGNRHHRDDENMWIPIDLRHMRPEQLHQIQLPFASLRRAHLMRHDLRGANFKGARLHLANLRGANLTRAVFHGALMGEARLRGADLFLAEFYDADLSDADFLGADLGFAQLQKANLQSANLIGADAESIQAQGADLLGAELLAANFREAELQGSVLNGASLDGADFRNARLSGGLVQFFVDPEVGRLIRLDDDLPFVSVFLDGLYRIELNVPPASLLFDEDPFLFPSSSIQLPEDAISELREEIIDGTVGAVWWWSRDEAEKYLRARLKERAGVFIDRLVQQPLRLDDANLDGVHINGNTSLEMVRIRTEPTPSEALERASVQPMQPYTFPSWSELVQLTTDQTTQGSKQASEAQSRP